MRVLTANQRISVAVAIIGSISQAAFALSHTGGANVGQIDSVKLYDAADPARPVLARETEQLTRSGPLVMAHDGVFVASGRDVRRYDRRDLSLPATAVWTASAPVMALADGNERGLVLILDARALTLVRFADGSAPVALWSYPIDAAGENPGRLLVRDGSRAYVADGSIPGIRVLSVDPAQAPATIATYTSTDGTIHDLSLWGRRLALAADAGLVVVAVSEGDQPVLQRIGALATRTAPARVDANSRYALVADGQDLRVVDIDPNSPEFLSGSLDAWRAPAEIRSVRLDKENRAYVLLEGAYEILDVAGYGGR